MSYSLQREVVLKVADYSEELKYPKSVHEKIVKTLRLSPHLLENDCAPDLSAANEMLLNNAGWVWIDIVLCKTTIVMQRQKNWWTEQLLKIFQQDRWHIQYLRIGINKTSVNNSGASAHSHEPHLFLLSFF